MTTRYGDRESLKERERFRRELLRLATEHARRVAAMPPHLRYRPCPCEGFAFSPPRSSP